MSELCNAHQVISLLQKIRQIFWSKEPKISKPMPSDSSISKSARSLVIRIPSDLTKYLEIDEKSKVEMIPLSKKRFLIEVK